MTSICTRRPSTDGLSTLTLADKLHLLSKEQEGYESASPWSQQVSQSARRSSLSDTPVDVQSSCQQVDDGVGEVRLRHRRRVASCEKIVGPELHEESRMPTQSSRTSIASSEASACSSARRRRCRRNSKELSPRPPRR